MVPICILAVLMEGQESPQVFDARLRIMANVLIILSDEHSPRFMGCSGHPEQRPT